MHFTLAFIGYVPDASVTPASEALRAGVAGRLPIEARLGAVGAFPSPRRPRAVYVGLAGGAEEVLACALAVRDQLGAREVPFDDKPPVAHLTVARLREDASAQDRAALARAIASPELAVPGLGFRIASATLFESRLSPRGPTYLPLATAALAGP